MNKFGTMALFATIASLSAPGAGGARSQSDAPALAAHERLLKRFLRSFNSGDRGALTEFASSSLTVAARRGRSPGEIAQNDLDLRNQAGGGFDLCRIEKNTGPELVALLKSHGEFPHYSLLTMMFDAAQPDQIARRGMWQTDPPSDLLPPRQSPEALAADIDAKLDRLASEDRFYGAVMIARNGNPVWSKAYGYANREAKTPNRLSTRFRLGSMNKMITAVAVAQLVEAGKLKYSETLAEALPDYPDAEAARKITLHHLLTHTSGLGDIFTPEFEKTKANLHELKDYLPLFANKPLLFAPGAGWSYSNAGFVVLGLVIERASGQSYYDYVQTHIYNAAHMMASGSAPKSQAVPDMAIGYMRPEPDAPLVSNSDTLLWRGISAGGGDSTLSDLLRFDQALRHHKLLSAEATGIILTGKVQAGPAPDRKYAYGFEDTQSGGHHIVGHSGGAPGMNAQMDMYLDNGMTVIVLSNLDPPAASQVANYIRLRLR